MPLARDLNELIHRYRAAIAAGAEAVLRPHHTPGSALLLPELLNGTRRKFNTGESGARQITRRICRLIKSL